MKTMKKIYSISCLVLAFSLLLSQKTIAQTMSFDSPVLIAGVDNQVGAIYRFSNVQTGTDAIVSVDSIVNGAVLKDIDKTGWGYVPAFQPSIQPPSGNVTAYVVFTMKFVTSATFIPVNVPLFNLTVLDVDGSNNLKEFDIVDMGGGVATYNATPSEISLTSNGTAFKGLNVAGLEHGGPDTTEKVDIFTVTKANVSQLTIKAGTVGTSNSNASRKYSFFPAGVSYPIAASNLPVKLASFTATLNNDNKVDLNWTTVTETNVSHFVIERSFDGKNFGDAGMVFAAGNTTETQHYSFTDNISSFQSPVIYYRLRSVDIDGKFDYSDIRIIRAAKQIEKAITILTYPNPVSNELRITIPSSWQNKRVLYEVVNVNGQVTKSTQSASSSQTETIDVSNLSTGLYVVRVSCDGQTAQEKIIKH